MQVARQCDPTKAHSNPVAIHVIQAHSHCIDSQSLCNLKYLHSPSNQKFSFRETQRQEKLKRDESYSNQSVVSTKLFSKIEGILKL